MGPVLNGTVTSNRKITKRPVFRGKKNGHVRYTPIGRWSIARRALFTLSLRSLVSKGNRTVSRGDGFNLFLVS